MINQALVAEKRYEGKYVALESFTNNRVVSSGSDPERVIKNAEKKGVTAPVLLFIPKGNLTQVY